MKNKEGPDCFGRADVWEACLSCSLGKECAEKHNELVMVEEVEK